MSSYMVTPIKGTSCIRCGTIAGYGIDMGEIMAEGDDDV